MSITTNREYRKKEEGSVLPQPTPISSSKRKSLEEHTRCFPPSSHFSLIYRCKRELRKLWEIILSFSCCPAVLVTHQTKGEDQDIHRLVKNSVISIPLHPIIVNPIFSIHICAQWVFPYYDNLSHAILQIM